MSAHDLIRPLNPISQEMRLATSNRSIYMLISVLWSTTLGAETVSLLDREFVPQLLPVAGNEKGFASADINKDGHADLIVLQSRLNEAAVYLGSANGRFRENGRFAAGQAPSHLTATDVDMDSNTDLVIANHDTANLTLLLGDGTGAFVAAPDSPLHVGVDPHVHVAHSYDIDGDKIKDLIVDSRNDNGVIILRGKGNGTFEVPGVTVDMGGDPYLGVAVGDINGDELPDLVSPNQDSIGVALNTSSDVVSFRLSQPIEIDTPFALALADTNSDGNLDLVVASDGRRSQVRILQGDGRGNFDVGNTPIPVARGAKSIATGDITGDGAADIVVTGWSSPEVVIISGRGVPEYTRITLDDIDNPWGALIADLNGDGLGDLTIADGVKPVAIIYMSRPTTN
jgi:VCBS repeat protein